MCDLGKGRPEGAPVIERIEDDVAARRIIIVRDELAAGVTDQGGFAPRLDPVEQLAQGRGLAAAGRADHRHVRSEEHTSELQSLMRISYAVFCLKKKKQNTTNTTEQQ